MNKNILQIFNKYRYRFLAAPLLAVVVIIGFQNFSSTSTPSPLTSVYMPAILAALPHLQVIIDIPNSSQVTASTTAAVPSGAANETDEFLGPASSATSDTPMNAFDGWPNTQWYSGGKAPQWIQVDLGKGYNLSKIVLTAGQTTAGATTHQIWGGSTTSAMSLLGTLSGTTQDFSRLTFQTLAKNIRYIKILTTESPAVVAWREIAVYQGTEFNLVHWPKYFGFFCDSCDAAFNTAAISPFSNVTMVRTGESSKLSAAAANNMKVILAPSVAYPPGPPTCANFTNNSYDACTDLSHCNIFFDENFNLEPSWQTRWQKYLAMVQTYIPLSNIVAVYPMDEPVANLLVNACFKSLSASAQATRITKLKTDLGTVNAYIHQTVPGVATAVTFNHTEVDPQYFLNLPTSLYTFSIPAGFDWVSFDWYNVWSEVQDKKSIVGYFNLLKSKMNSSQKLFVVADSFYAGTNFNLSTITAQDLNHLQDQLDRFFGYALNEPLVIGVFPFLYQSEPNPGTVVPSKVTMVGAESMPEVLQKNQSFGSMIQSH